MQEFFLTPRQCCDIECLLNGAFSPLIGFNDQKTYDSIIKTRRLPSGEVWPMPITLDMSFEQVSSIQAGDSIRLYDEEGLHLANMLISDIWRPNKIEEALAIYQTVDDSHPGVNYLMHQTKEYYVGGILEKVALPHHYDFTELRLSPQALKKSFQEKGFKKIVAFQTRNPMHRAHQELTLRAAKEHGAHLLIHPVVGMTKPGDVDHYTRVRCYQRLMATYPENTATLSLLPIAMRMAGPVEALWHALIRKNYGCTHFIVGRDHAGPGKDKNGHDFYGPYDAQKLVQEYENEIGIHMIPFHELVYVKERDAYVQEDQIEENETVLKLSGTEFRRILKAGEEVPAWFSYPGIIDELRKTFPAREKQGLAIFFTGLSGAGKSSIANALLIKLMEISHRSITLLDGDLVRKNLSSELGFSKEHRDLNILRIGYVASEIVKHGGIAICAPIAPYRLTRRSVRERVSEFGGFIEVYISTPLNVCEERDRKGLYKKARAGVIKEFTGISDPYEVPENPDIIINTVEYSIEAAVFLILNKLKALGYINHDSQPRSS